MWFVGIFAVTVIFFNYAGSQQIWRRLRFHAVVDATVLHSNVVASTVSFDKSQLDKHKYVFCSLLWSPEKQRNNKLWNHAIDITCI